MIVLDASAAVDVSIGREPHRSWVRDRLDGQEIQTPHVFLPEALAAVRGLVLRGEVTEDRGAEAVSFLLDLPKVQYPHDPLIPRAWELRHSVSAYDAMYIALAEALDASLVTTDRALARAHGHGARVIVPPGRR